ncbi:hypothetical protein IWQ61_003309 [Dispira simplex]|nr:hypothetical protein IWQ61_003309 [Dispira simplex]
MEQETSSKLGSLNQVEFDQKSSIFQRGVSFSCPNGIYDSHQGHQHKKHRNADVPRGDLQDKELRKKPSHRILKLRPSKAAVKELTQRVTLQVRKRFSRPSFNSDTTTFLYHQPNPSTDTNLFSSYQTYLRHRKRQLAQTATLAVPAQWPKRMWFKLKKGWQNCVGTSNSLVAHPADLPNGPDIVDVLTQQLSLISLSLFPFPTGMSLPNGDFLDPQTAHGYGNSTLSSEGMYNLPDIFSYETIRLYRQKGRPLTHVDRPEENN